MASAFLPRSDVRNAWRPDSSAKRTSSLGRPGRTRRLANDARRVEGSCPARARSAPWLLPSSRALTCETLGGLNPPRSARHRLVVQAEPVASLTTLAGWRGAALLAHAQLHGFCLPPAL